MKLAALTLAALTLMTAGAGATPRSERYVATGGSASVDQFLHLGVTLEAGHRLGDTRMFARGQVSSGMSGDESIGRGSYRQARAGLEARDCIADEWVCGFTGVDLGYGREHLMVPYSAMGVTDVRGVSAVPRIGFDGGNQVRVRLALELPIYDRLGGGSTHLGGGATFGVGYQF